MTNESAWKTTKGKWGQPNYPKSIPKLPSTKGTSIKYDKNPWNLAGQGLNLPLQAADYYLLAWVQAEKELFGDVKQGELWSPFAKKLKYLVGQFSRYTDMAVGGELRHARTKVLWTKIPKPILDGLKSSKLPVSRNSAWHGWYFMRQQYGTIALRWAMMTFQKFKGGAFGGLKWSVIAETLWKYEAGVYTGQTFVDTAWGLEHNGGCYFNKRWSPSYKGVHLKSILDANQKGNYSALMEHASLGVLNHLAKAGKAVM